jgi:alcohol dehydrogenase class IV
MAFNAPETGEAMGRVARALGTKEAAGGMWDLAVKLGAPVSLQEIGMERRHIERAVALAVANPYWNPRQITRDGIRELFMNAFEGKRPV